MSTRIRPPARTRTFIRCPSAAATPKKITISPGADDAPLYSPDGKYLAFRSQARAGYESDRWRLMVLERATGRTTNLTESLDRWVEQHHVVARFDAPVFHGGRSRAHRLADDPCDRRRRRGPSFPATSSLDDVQFNSDGRTMIYTEQSGSRPTEIFRASSTGGTGSRADASERCAAEREHADAARRNSSGELG